MYYLSRRDNETRVKVDEQYSNEHTIMVEYLNGKKKGKTVSMTHSTFKRWWKKIKEEQTIIPQESTVEKVTEPNIITTAKTDDKKSVKTKKVKNSSHENEIIKLCSYLKELKAKFYESNNSYKIMDSNNKPLAEVYPQKKKIVCYFKSLEGLDLTNTLFHRDGYKYYLPARIDISYDIDFIEKISLMLQTKNTLKED